MLLKVDLNWKLLQVVSGEEHPDCDAFGYITCPFCSSHLQGHGWRQRHLESGPRAFILVWVHRKRCPRCGRTYTLIPEGMAAVAQYPLERIGEALSYRHRIGHCSKSLGIPVPTQKRWWRRFTARLRAERGMFPAEAEAAEAACDPTPLSVAPIGWMLITDRANLRSLQTRCGPPHHIMLLPSLAVAW